MESILFTSYSIYSLALETGTKHLMVLISYWTSNHCNFERESFGPPLSVGSVILIAQIVSEVPISQSQWHILGFISSK